MNEENNQIYETQSSENQISEQPKKQIPLIAFIAVAIVAVALIVVLLVVLLGGDKSDDRDGKDDENTSESEGDKEDDDEDEKSETKNLTALECYNELNKHYEKTKAGKSHCYWQKNEGENVVSGEGKTTVYYDGENYFVHTYFAKDDLGWEIYEQWCGKVGDEYVLVTRRESDGKETKYYEVVDEEYLSEMVEECIDDVYGEYIESTLELLLDDEGDTECIKTTEGKDQHYLIKLPSPWGDEGDKLLLELYIEDGYIVKYVQKDSEWGDTVVNYPRDQKVTIPDLSDFEER